MGYIRHNAIVVSSQMHNYIVAAVNKAIELDLQALGPSCFTTNNYTSMLICPDGSKEGWLESDAGDIKRAKFKEWLDSQKYEDNSTSYEWVEIAYNNDYYPEIIDQSFEYRAKL